MTEQVINPSVKDAIRRWREHPEIMVRELFGVTPDAWQDEALRAFPTSPRVALKACKGPGKTATLSWLCWNFLLTRPHPKIPATSISKENLMDGLWTEMAKWQNTSKLLQQMFTWTKTRIFANDHPETWYMTARTWSKSADKDQQANTLAGLHADYILFVLDESGGIPESVMVTAEAALASGVEMHIVQAGNPTHLEGPLYRACTTEAKLWKVITITGDPDDVNRSPRISVKWAREMIEKYGRENPWVLVNVLGRFPPSSLNSLIGPDEVRAAMERIYTEYQVGNAPMILGVDVAREGDDASVIFGRKGRQAFNPVKLRNVDGLQGAGHVSRLWRNMNADACFVDATGGFGSSWIDQLRVLNYTPLGIHFSAAAHQSDRYYNKRTEMYFDAVQWIKEGGALPPNVPEILAALTQTTYSFAKDRLLLEPKESVKEKLGYSPDDADAFVLTFAEPVLPKAQVAIAPPRGHTAHQDWNPYAQPAQNPMPADWNPFK